MKAIIYFIDDVDATDEDHKEYVRELIDKNGPKCSFCNLDGRLKFDCTQFWDTVADARLPLPQGEVIMSEGQSSTPDE